MSGLEKEAVALGHWVCRTGFARFLRGLALECYVQVSQQRALLYSKTRQLATCNLSPSGCFETCLPGQLPNLQTGAQRVGAGSCCYIRWRLRGKAP